ncbi:hypothetical protein BH09PAT1_BH09PAT1_8180 [soil metagenome]
MNSKVKEVVLSIDTSKHDKLVVGLCVNDVEKIIEEAFDYHKSQGILPLIEQILSKNKISTKEITEINVNTGPGSFTGLRVGVAVTNTLGTLLQIPINNLPVGSIVEPIYQ